MLYIVGPKLIKLVPDFAAAQWGQIVEIFSEKSKAPGWSQTHTG